MLRWYSILVFTEIPEVCLFVGFRFVFSFCSPFGRALNAKALFDLKKYLVMG